MHVDGGTGQLLQGQRASRGCYRCHSGCCTMSGLVGEILRVSEYLRGVTSREASLVCDVAGLLPKGQARPDVAQLEQGTARLHRT